ncbi:MAG: hypothetical protein QM621_09600 [Aeromicrobium sp.]|uniref:hypothetical protein n=1 Tax=Aeromicrobium sp. TaxID=1871063 RepID=UPI0039E5CD3A
MNARPDLTNLPRFLHRLGVDRLGPRDAEAAGLAQAALEAGWTVEDFIGPVQMDVWSLSLRRGERRLRFGIERGYADGVRYDDGGGWRTLSADEVAALTASLSADNERPAGDGQRPRRRRS